MMGMISLVLSLILAALFSLFLSRHFTARIFSLMHRCSEIADENPAGRIQPILPVSGDELDMLTCAFDRMAGNLAASREQSRQAHAGLLEAKDELELRVRERTRELEDANHRLTGEIRERERMETVLERTARTDYLTSLLNRRAMMHCLEQAVSRFRRSGQVFSLVMLDIDRFKSVNDTHGHPAGDQLLVHVAGFLKNGTRETDEISRWGGEEFLILLPETDLRDAADQAERLREGLSGKAFSLEGKPVSISASFGVVRYRGDLNLQSLLRQVDACLYEAKNQGRDRVVCTET
jgi:diguanylate cyclase (GGDEF)-like protein